jgi:hypothetical protein
MKHRLNTDGAEKNGGTSPRKLTYNCLRLSLPRISDVLADLFCVILRHLRINQYSLNIGSEAEDFFEFVFDLLLAFPTDNAEG